MDTIRRSPRNHVPSSKTNLRIKAAVIRWEDDDSALLYHLVSAMESNRRWRNGIFSSRPTTGAGSLHAKAHKVQYYDEIARALFSCHPRFRILYRKKPASFARAVKDKLDSFPSSCLVGAPRMSGKSTQTVSRVALLSYRNVEAWTHLRITQSSPHEPMLVPLWLPRLPLELQCEIITFALTTNENPEDIDLPVAANLCAVNSTWANFIAPLLYKTITIRRSSHSESLFGIGSSLSRMGSPARYTKILKLFTQPDIPFCCPIYHNYNLGFTIPEVHFDVASARDHFSIIQRLPGETHIQEFANHCNSLYQLLLDLRSTKLRLFMATPISESEDIALWGEVMSGHIAALKILVHIRELVVDGDLYMTLLPKCVQEWAHGPNWETIISMIKDNGDDTLPTLLDETHLNKVTFYHSHVPTLAFLSRMALASGITNISLSGWNTGAETPKSWRRFIDREREAGHPVIAWLDN